MMLPVIPPCPIHDLTLVIPTYNEAKNVEELIARVTNILQGVNWEMIVVDDNSPDKTYDLVKVIAQDSPRIRCLRRVGRRGLSGACIEGIMASSAKYVAVMDADLQHDETILPQMLTKMQDHDIVVATRYSNGGTAQGLSERRQKVSRLGDFLSRSVVRVPVSDPMSGFFMVKRKLVDDLAPKLATSGFKILVDILSNVPNSTQIAEVSYHFRDRFAGDSKLDAHVLFDYAGFLLHRISGGILPVRFLMFVLVGGIGLLVHLMSLRLFLSLPSHPNFIQSQSVATGIAMLSNFWLNNRLTYRDARLKGTKFLIGLVVFCLSCSIGAVANIGIANWLYDSAQNSWWLSGAIGALMGAVWNYAASNTFVWRKTE